jgi:hypothetical protein
MDLLFLDHVIIIVNETTEIVMEFVLLSTVLVAAMATVDLPAKSEETDEEATRDDLRSGEKPYGVHG